MSDDQRALLRLLAQREEGYEDIAALMGLSVDEVRRRVKDALAELNEGAPGAARDETAKAAGPVGAGDPPPPPVAEASSGVVPPAPPPAAEAAAPATPRVQASAASAKSRKASGGTKSHPKMPEDRRRLAELIGGAVVVLLVVLFAAGVIDLGGGDDSGSDSETNTPQAVAKGSTKLTQAILEAVDGSDAEGLAVFARANKNGVRLLLQAEGLEPSGEGQAYAVSLTRSADERIPIAVTKVPQSGKVEAQYPIPSESLGLLASGFDQMELSLVSNPELQAALAQAGKEQKAPDYDGEDVLRGEVTGPIVNIAEEEGEN